MTTERDQERQRALELHARAVVHSDDFDAAEKDLAEALELCPELAQVWFDRGLLHQDHGHLGQAVTYFEHARARDRDNAEYNEAWSAAHRNLARTRQQPMKQSSALASEIKQTPGPPTKLPLPPPMTSPPGDPEAHPGAPVFVQSLVDYAADHGQAAATTIYEEPQGGARPLPGGTAVMPTGLPGETPGPGAAGDILHQVARQRAQAPGAGGTEVMDTRELAGLGDTPPATGADETRIDDLGMCSGDATQEMSATALSQILLEEQARTSASTIELGEADLVRVEPPPIVAGEPIRSDAQQQVSGVIEDRSREPAPEENGEAAGSLSPAVESLLALADDGMPEELLAVLDRGEDPAPQLDEAEETLVRASAHLARARLILQQAPAGQGLVARMLQQLRERVGD